MGGGGGILLSNPFPIKTNRIQNYGHNLVIMNSEHKGLGNSIKNKTSCSNTTKNPPWNTVSQKPHSRNVQQKTFNHIITRKNFSTKI